MTNVLIINGHQYYPFAEGNLNKSLVNQAQGLLTKTLFQRGFEND